jgi:hypothetical protein
MRILRLLSIGATILLLAFSASSQQAKIDPAFFGFWNLEVSKSNFGGQPSPKSGQVDWGGHGWDFALVLADGGIGTDGVATDQGCVYIGPSVLSCEYEVVTPRHEQGVGAQGHL